MEKSDNIAIYIFKNQKETIKASIIDFFKRNNLYATSEKYDHPKDNNFSFNLCINILTFKCFRTVKDHIDLEVRRHTNEHGVIAEADCNEIVEYVNENLLKNSNLKLSEILNKDITEIIDLTPKNN